MNYRKALFIEGNRDCYHPEQRENSTITAKDLIAILQDFDEDAKVFIRNDNGYTYGTITYDDITDGIYNDDEVLLNDGSEEYYQASEVA